MKEFTNETPSELLTQLMDNELDAGREAGLYEALGTSPELQEELKYHLAVKEVVRKDIEAFTPPPDAVRSVFESLGYAPPPSSSPGIIRKSPFALMFLRRAAVPLLLLIAGSYGAYTLLNSSDGNNGITKNNSGLEKTEIVQTVNSDLNKQSGTFLNGTSEIKTAKVRKYPVISSVSPAAKQIAVNQVSEAPILIEEIVTNNTIVLATMSPIQTSRSNFNMAVNQNNPGFILPIRSNFSENGLQKSNYAVFVKGINNFNSNLGNAFSTIDNFPSNLSIGLSYSASDAVNVLGEIGQKSFMIIEDKSISNLKPVTFFGVSVQLHQDIEFLTAINTRPFAQFTVGFNNDGQTQYLYGGAVGLDFNPFNSSLGFMAGYEFTNLKYSFNSQSLDAVSEGIFIGFSYGF